MKFSKIVEARGVMPDDDRFTAQQIRWFTDGYLSTPNSERPTTKLGIRLTIEYKWGKNFDRADWDYSMPDYWNLPREEIYKQIYKCRLPRQTKIIIDGREFYIASLYAPNAVYYDDGSIEIPCSPVYVEGFELPNSIDYDVWIRLVDTRVIEMDL